MLNILNIIIFLRIITILQILTLKLDDIIKFLLIKTNMVNYSLLNILLLL